MPKYTFPLIILLAGLLLAGCDGGTAPAQALPTAPPGVTTRETRITPPN